MRRREILLDQLIECVFAIMQGFGYVHVHLAGAISSIELGHALEKSRDAGDSDVERFHGYSSAVPHIVQTGPFPVYHRSYYTAAFRWIRVGIGALIAFQIQAKNKAVISAEYFLQILSRSSTRRLFIGYTATNEGAPDLIVEIFAVGHDYKSKIPWNR